MCGRAYITFTDKELEMRYLNQQPVQLPVFSSTYNLAPSQACPVIRVRDGKKEIALLKWGLIPSWAKDSKIAYSTINARAETVAEKPAFRSAFLQRRCIIPLSGFFEWKKTPSEKRPFRISLKNTPIMSIAGLWEKWRSPETGDSIETFSIITMPANNQVRDLHDRMPLILRPEDEEAWLAPDNNRPEDIKPLLKELPDNLLELVEISTAVNNPRNNAPDILEPLKKAQ